MSIPKAEWYAERGWREAGNPHLLAEILDLRKVKSPRKYRLAAVACFERRRVGMTGPQLDVLDAAEVYADGLINWGRLLLTAERCPRKVRGTKGWAARQTAHRLRRVALREVLENLLHVRWSFPEAGPQDHLALFMCGVIRDVFGNPFRPLSLKSYCSPDVLLLAKGIYDEKDWSRMGVLGDALQDAGCQDEAVLEHCRGESHVRGCWVVDALLAKR